MSWGPTGPLIMFPLWSRPMVVSIGFLGYYGALCDEPFYYAYYYLLSQVASSRFPFPLLIPSWLPSWESTGVGNLPLFLITLNTPPLPGAKA